MKRISSLHPYLGEDRGACPAGSSMLWGMYQAWVEICSHPQQLGGKQIILWLDLPYVCGSTVRHTTGKLQVTWFIPLGSLRTFSILPKPKFLCLPPRLLCCTASIFDLVMNQTQSLSSSGWLEWKMEKSFPVLAACSSRSKWSNITMCEHVFIYVSLYAVSGSLNNLSDFSFWAI